MSILKTIAGITTKMYVGYEIIKLLSGTPAFAREPIKEEPKVSFGYNALETGFLDKEGVRSRAINNVSLNLENVQFSYHGLNQVNNGDTDTYFGRHRIMFGKKDANIKGLVDIRTNSKKVINTRYGIRNTTLVKLLFGDYGQIDVTTNKKAANINLFYGKKLGKGFLFELVQSTDFPFKGKPKPYTELMLIKDIKDNFSLYVRAEIPKFDIDKRKVIAGFKYNF